MGHYNSATPKRHYAYSNSKVIKRIDKGALQGWRGKTKVVTAEHYVDKSGRKRYKGTSNLRGTETLVFKLKVLRYRLIHFTDRYEIR